MNTQEVFIDVSSTKEVMEEWQKGKDQEIFFREEIFGPIWDSVWSLFGKEFRKDLIGFNAVYLT